MLRYASIKFLALVGICLFLTACAGVSPSELSDQRAEYNESLSHADVDQMLLNVVRLRHLDSPVFLQVNSITSQNSLQLSANLAYSLYTPPGGTTPNTISPGVTYTQSPTVSYTPLQGAQFTQNLLSPISLLSVYYLTNAGWNIEKVFRLSLQNIGDFYNEPGYITSHKSISPKQFSQFMEVCHLLLDLQKQNAIDFYFDANQQTSLELFIVNFHKSALQLPQVKKLRQLLKLQPDAHSILFTTDYSLQVPNVVYIKTRSIMATMSFLANNVPDPWLSSAQQITTIGDNLIHVQYSKDRPKHPSSMRVYYDNYYYYVDDTDVESKRIFVLLHNLYQLSAGLAGGTSGVVLSLPVSK